MISYNLRLNQNIKKNRSLLKDWRHDQSARDLLKVKVQFSPKLEKVVKTTVVILVNTAYLFIFSLVST